MKSYLEEVYDDAITNQDVDTNFSELLRYQLIAEFIAGDADALAGEIAELMIESGRFLNDITREL